MSIIGEKGDRAAKESPSAKQQEDFFNMENADEGIDPDQAKLVSKNELPRNRLLKFIFPSDVIRMPVKMLSMKWRPRSQSSSGQTLSRASAPSSQLTRHIDELSRVCRSAVKSSMANSPIYYQCCTSKEPTGLFAS